MTTERVTTEIEIEFVDGRTMTCPVDNEGALLLPPPDMGYGEIVRYRTVLIDGDTTSLGRWVNTGRPGPP